MYCRKCGKEVEGDREFCESCAPQTPSVDMKICQYCGKETSKAERFCQHCGGYFKDSTAPQKKWQPSDNHTGREQSINMKICRSCSSSIPKSNVYCSKCGKMADVTPYHTPQQSGKVGSFAVGFILVWFIGIIGVIIAYSLNESETWRGAKVAFNVCTIILVVALAIVGIATCAMMQESGYYY